MRALRFQFETLNGTIPLTGLAASETESSKAERVAHAMPNVKDVGNNIIVGPHVP